MPRTKLKRIMALLLDPELKITSKYGLAKMASCTPAWVIMLTKKLEKKKLLKGLKVINAKKLFELFNSIRPKRQTTKSYSIYQFNNINELIGLLYKSKKEYAFTTYAAENIVQKYLFSHRVDIYVKKEDLQKWHEDLVKIGSYGGGNIRLIVSEYDELFGKKQFPKSDKKSPWIVNTPQLISDLYAEGGPAKEAGDLLLQKLKKSLMVKN
jgi:hypothetical protein